MYKRLISMLLVFVLLMGTFAYAEGETWLETDETEAIFTDVNQDDWFYEAVMTMNRYGIISGYGDNTFRPMNPVKREEFAVMMVLALQLEKEAPASSFSDVSDGYWASTWIETAKPYLTGWLRNGEYVFKPTEEAVREDMAVALVRALKKPADSSMLYELEAYEDSNEISSNLKNYMASAIYHDLMGGYDIEGKKYLKPLGSLTRAEAAALLLSVVKEEKIVFDEEEKVVLDEGDFALTSKVVENGITLSWDYNTEDKVSGYKVVASKDNDAPMYPDDGYLTYTQNTSYTVSNYTSYNGDISKFEPGETYYFAITALVGDEKVSSNVLKLTMPEAASTEGKVPEVTVVESGEGLLIKWNEMDRSGLEGYKVVASKSDSTPIYPDNGYATWLTDLDVHSYFVQDGTSYKGGDLGGSFKAGETYHVSITAVYNSGKIAGNTVTITMPGEKAPEVSISEKTPTVEVAVVNGKVVVEWSEINRSGLNGYKIVASKSNPNPVYSQDGYAFWLTDLDTHRKEFSAGTSYSGGDLDGKFVSGESYYISVTAVYNDGKIAGNAVKITMP